jgi:hypothetical protein
MLFPKPGKRPKQKRNREIDNDYVVFIKGFPCCNPNCGSFPVDAHHVQTKARLGSDRTCLPFCHSCHLRHIHGRGEKTCQREWGIVFDDLVIQYNQAYEKNELGEFHNIAAAASKKN